MVEAVPVTPETVAVIVIEPTPVKVTEPLQTPLDQPEVPVLVGLIDPEETLKPTELL